MHTKQWYSGLNQEMFLLQILIGSENSVNKNSMIDRITIVVLGLFTKGTKHILLVWHQSELSNSVSKL